LEGLIQINAYIDAALYEFAPWLGRSLPVRLDYIRSSGKRDGQFTEPALWASEQAWSVSTTPACQHHWVFRNGGHRAWGCFGPERQ
jgi:hypothetical protein